MNCSRCDRAATRRGLCHRCYENNRRRQKAYGHWQSDRVDAEPIRRHVEALRASGVGSRRIADLSGVSRSVIQALINGRKIYRHEPSKTISATNAARLLAVQAAPAPGGRVDITGTTRRLQALVAIGYTQSDLAGRIGVTPANSTNLFKGVGTVRAATAARIADLYESLAMTPGPSQRARNHATKLGWAPPLAWDDDTIDNPTATPDRGEKRVVKFDERYLELRDLGYSDLEILHKLAVKPESLLRQLDRYNIPARPELVKLATSQRWKKQAAS